MAQPSLADKTRSPRRIQRDGRQSVFRLRPERRVDLDNRIVVIANLEVDFAAKITAAQSTELHEVVHVSGMQRLQPFVESVRDLLQVSLNLKYHQQ